MGIHIENYCEDELEFRNGLPVSTKGDDNYHGFGMKSIQYVVEKYGGNLVANLEEKIFSVDIIFPVLDQSLFQTRSRAKLIGIYENKNVDMTG